MESQPPLVKSWHTIRIWIGKMIQSNNESEHLRQKCILGIDPGTNVMGYGLLQVSGNKASLLVMGVIDMRKVVTLIYALATFLNVCRELLMPINLTRWQ